MKSHNDNGYIDLLCKRISGHVNSMVLMLVDGADAEHIRKHIETLIGQMSILLDYIKLFPLIKKSSNMSNYQILVERGINVPEALANLQKQMVEKIPIASKIIALQVCNEIVVSTGPIMQPGQPQQGQLVYNAIACIQLPPADEDLQTATVDGLNDMVHALDRNMSHWVLTFSDAMRTYQEQVTTIMREFIKSTDELRETMLAVAADKGGK